MPMGNKGYEPTSKKALSTSYHSFYKVQGPETKMEIRHCCQTRPWGSEALGSKWTHLKSMPVSMNRQSPKFNFKGHFHFTLVECLFPQLILRPHSEVPVREPALSFFFSGAAATCGTGGPTLGHRLTQVLLPLSYSGGALLFPEW